MKDLLFHSIILMSIFCFVGNASAVEKRIFHEVNIEPEEEQVSDQADPHALMGEMPDDDIHAAFRKNQGAVPDREAMPDDDIHKQFKSGPAMSGGMAMDPALMNSVAPSSLSWSVPEGWQEEKGSGMRIATFKAGVGDLAVETSVISLAGGAGGMAANVSRWMGQLNLDVPSAVELDKFIERQENIKTSSGLAVKLIDFTQMQNDDQPEVPSMIAAVVEGTDNQVFIKMTGSRKAILKNFDAFKALVGSLKDGSGE
jgi:hypothetical protein